MLAALTTSAAFRTSIPRTSTPRATAWAVVALLVWPAECAPLFGAQGDDPTEGTVHQDGEQEAPGTGEPAHGKGEIPYLTPPEIMKLMEESKITYRIGLLKELRDVTPEKFAEVFWPVGGAELGHPWVEVGADGQRSLLEYRVDSRARDLVAKGEPFFDKKEYEKGLEFYRRATEADPNYYLAHAYVGDCHFFSGRHEEALKHYRKSIELNPYDHRLYLFEGRALHGLGRNKEARASLIRGLALKPKHASLIKALKASSKVLGVTVREEPFIPKSLARKEGDAIAIYIGPGEAEAPWLLFANCKAIWLGEPAHREAMTGSTEHNWTNTEERECLASLIVGYENLPEKQKKKADPALARLPQILEDGLLDQFIFYEIGSRFHPNIMLLMDDGTRDRMADYIARYVVVPAER